MKTYELATFAGGCFWCMVSPFDKIPGVKKVVSGYAGGHKENPTYEEVCSKKTGHYEAVQITFDPQIISYEELLKIYWRQIDPTDHGGQFFDRGEPYQVAIFYHNAMQKEKAEASKKALAESGKFERPIVTRILPAGPFYAAEEYHQDYYKKNNWHYNQYRKGSGRDAFVKKHWPQEKNKDRDDLKKRLTKSRMLINRKIEITAEVFPSYTVYVNSCWRNETRWNMNTKERKIQQRITRRKKKVQRMIREQKTRLAALDSVTYLRQEDYLRALRLVKNKLYRLKQELQGLESGMLRWKE
ncbi:MAG: peptide-methionine (S)-S-oxide reductase MsrA [Dethiobacteria bacterium]